MRVMGVESVVDSFFAVNMTELNLKHESFNGNQSANGNCRHGYPNQLSGSIGAWSIVYSRSIGAGAQLWRRGTGRLFVDADHVWRLALPFKGVPKFSRSLPKFCRVRQTFSRLSHGDPANLNPAGWFLDFVTVDLSLNSCQ